MTFKLSERYEIDKENLKRYEIVDRKPPIFDVETHISNISDITPLYFPDSVKRNISTYLFHQSKSINLKILEFMIKRNKIEALDDFKLTNNNIKYISCILSEAGYNAIFFENPSEFDPTNRCIRLHISKHDSSRDNVMILTDCDNPYYDEYAFSNILNDEIEFHDFEKENIETCLDFRHALINNTGDLKDYYFHFDHKVDYQNFMEKPLCGYESAIHASTCWICDKCSTELICGRKQNTSNINFQSFLFLLIESCLEYGDVNYIIVLIFLNKVISFGHTHFNQGLTLIEVYENGDITIPNYSLDEITNMKQWRIEELLKYSFVIKNKRVTK